MAAKPLILSVFLHLHELVHEHEVVFGAINGRGPGQGRFPAIASVTEVSVMFGYAKNQKDKKVGVLRVLTLPKPQLFCLSDFWSTKTSQNSL